MIIKDINYPELLVEAIKNDKLVIFCGAGISMANQLNYQVLTNFRGK